MLKGNLIVVVGIIGIILIILKIMQQMKTQNEVSHKHTDLLLAVALKTGAIQPQAVKKEKTAKTKKEKVEVEEEIDEQEESDEPVQLKKILLTAKQKSTLKLLFGDEVPKTASKLRELHNKNGSKPMDTKKFNTMLWNYKSKGALDMEKLKDSDSVWGMSEWFETKGQLSEHYFSRIKA